MSDNVGELAALITALCWSFTAIFFNFSGRRVGSDVVNRSRLLFAIGMYGVVHLILYGQLLPQGAEFERWGWLGLSAILGLVIGDSALFQAYVLIGPRLAMLVMSLAPIMGVGLAWLLLGQTVAGRELAGIALTIGAVGWVVAERDTGAFETTDRRTFRLGVVLALVGAFGQASNLVAAERALTGGFSPLTASFMRMLIAALILWGLSAGRGDAGRIVRSWRDRPALGALLAGSVVGPFLGVSLSLVAIQNTRVGIAATLMALTPVMLIPLGRVVYGERITRRGVVGTVLAFVGVTLILLPD